MKSGGVSFWDLVDGASGLRWPFGAAASALWSKMDSCGTTWALFGSPRWSAFTEMDASPGPLLLLLGAPLGAGALRHLPWVGSPPRLFRHPPHTGPAPGLGGASRCLRGASDQVLQRDSRISDLDPN